VHFCVLSLALSNQTVKTIVFQTVFFFQSYAREGAFQEQGHERKGSRNVPFSVFGFMTSISSTGSYPKSCARATVQPRRPFVSVFVSYSLRKHLLEA
jgi:hypothetical protein